MSPAEFSESLTMLGLLKILQTSSERLNTSQEAQTHISRKSQWLIHEASRVVWLGDKLQEEPLKIYTHYKELYEERNMVDLQR